MSDSPNPVLLIPGLDDTTAVFSKMETYLEQRGWLVYSVNLFPSNGDVGLELLAQQVADYVATVLSGSQHFSLIGFSMGGIIGRYYLQRLGGLERVQRFIAISSPHQGTWTAYFRQNPGCQQMRPDSAFLTELNRDIGTLQQLDVTSIWTPFDLMILPAKSSQLPVGQTVTVPVLAHPWMLTDLQSLEAVVKALT